jgi:hypothetical protein
MKRGPVYCMAAGGVAFWLPPILLCAFPGENPNVLWLNLAPLLGLVSLALLDWKCLKWPVMWNWVLVGLYVLGPISILVESSFSGGSSWRIGIGLPLVFLLPPMTLLLSFYSAQFFCVLAVTIGLPIVEVIRRWLPDDLAEIRRRRELHRTA